MSTYMDIEEIKAKYRNGEYTHKMEEYPVYLNSSHIFDENLSVKRNREMIIEHNQMVDNMLREHKDKEHELCMKLRKDVVTYIVNTYNLSEVQARIVEGYVYNEQHAVMYDYFTYIDEIAYFVECVVNAKEV